MVHANPGRPTMVGSISYRLVAALAAWKALGCPSKREADMMEASGGPSGSLGRTSDLTITNEPAASHRP